MESTTARLIPKVVLEAMSALAKRHTTTRDCCVDKDSPLPSTSEGDGFAIIRRVTQNTDKYGKCFPRLMKCIEAAIALYARTRSRWVECALTGHAEECRRLCSDWRTDVAPGHTIGHVPLNISLHPNHDTRPAGRLVTNKYGTGSVRSVYRNTFNETSMAYKIKW